LFILHAQKIAELYSINPEKLKSMENDANKTIQQIINSKEGPFPTDAKRLIEAQETIEKIFNLKLEQEDARRDFNEQQKKATTKFTATSKKKIELTKKIENQKKLISKQKNQPKNQKKLEENQKELEELSRAMKNQTQTLKNVAEITKKVADAIQRDASAKRIAELKDLRLSEKQIALIMKKSKTKKEEGEAEKIEKKAKEEQKKSKMFELAGETSKLKEQASAFFTKNRQPNQSSDELRKENKEYDKLMSKWEAKDKELGEAIKEVTEAAEKK
jgi:hypothetical protein